MGLLLVVIIIIFSSRNINRINNEVQKYDYKPISNSFYYMDQGHFRMQILFDGLKNNYINCQHKQNKCDLKKLKRIKEIRPERYLFIND